MWTSAVTPGRDSDCADCGHGRCGWSKHQFSHSLDILERQFRPDLCDGQQSFIPGVAKEICLPHGKMCDQGKL
jgi:hypothetical protein